MQLENSFEVGAPPDRVFAYLLDVNRIVGCVPGAELSEVVDPNTFKGKVKIKVGPDHRRLRRHGTYHRSRRGQPAATWRARGGRRPDPATPRAKAAMTVSSRGGSRVKVSTDFTVAGRVAQFGRGLMEDVSKSLVAQMAACIKSQLETAEQPPAAAAEPVAPPPARGEASSAAASEPPPRPPRSSTSHRRRRRRPSRSTPWD